MSSEIFKEMHNEPEVLLLPDVFPNIGVQVEDPTIIDGLVNNCSIFTGPNISTADITFPKKTFGDHVKGLTPIKIAIKDTNALVFRGFIIEENGILSESEDTVTVRAMDYKWFFAKCTRVRGRWFTSDGSIPTPYGSPNTTGHGKLKYEMFRGPVVSGGGQAGYLQDQPCIFNEAGQPNCNTATHDGRLSIFKYRKMSVVDGLQRIEKYNWSVQYWTFSSILAHIVYWWLNDYSGPFTQIRVTNNSYSELSQLSSEDEIPMDLSIEDMNPLDAINEVVKNIPGRWIWFLTYDGSVVNIHVKNLDGLVGPFKKLFIGNNDKQALNPANVASLNVTRNWESSSTFVMLRGGKLRFTTTLELQPVWKKYNVTAGDYPYTVAYGVPFEDTDTFNEWKEYVTAQQKEKLEDGAKATLFDMAYRYYCIPQEGAFLGAALEAVTRAYGTELKGRLKTMYSAIEVALAKMFAETVNFKREYGPPEHPEFKNPVIFAYDDYYDKSVTETANVDSKRKIIYFESGYNFDDENGLVIFDDPQYCRFFSTKSKKDEETGEGWDGKKDNKKTSASQLDALPESMFNVNSQYNTLVHDKDTLYPLKSRRIFCTLSITLDMPYIVGDDVFGLNFSEGGNFARYVDFDGNDLRIHANAYYPALPNKKVTFTTGAYTMAADNSEPGEDSSFAVVLDADASAKLYPADRMADYETYPDNNDMLLLKKLDNMKLSMNRYDEDINANLGILDSSYGLGDIIIAIENSATENPGSGYYGMADYVAQISHALEGDTKGYSTSLVCTNKTDFTPRDYDKMVSKVYRRQDPFKVYKDNGFMEVDNA